jgi:hypothetical protein
MNNPIDMKEIDEHALDSALQLSRLFSVSARFHFPRMAHVFFPELMSNNCHYIRLAFSEICTKCDAHSLSDPSRNGFRPDTRLQIEGRKKPAYPAT